MTDVLGHFPFFGVLPPERIIETVVRAGLEEVAAMESGVVMTGSSIAVAMG